ncbi:MAG TPA: di-heme oxidoredictase family protein [Polyangiaceae bacterium]|nr:di-heme oxidoredictase family protein [Polyangiaceae bacterium]
MKGFKSRPAVGAGIALAIAAGGCSGGGAGEGTNTSELRPELGENLPGGETTNVLLFGGKAFTRAAENVTPEHERSFFTGNSFFNSSWVQAPASTTARDGLGPLFNARSCSTCHFEDGRGRPPLNDDEEFSSMLLRIGTGALDDDGTPEGDPNYGGQLQPFAIAGVSGEGTPRHVCSSSPGTFADGETYELLAPSYWIEAGAYGGSAGELALSPRVAPQMIGLGLLEAIPEERLRELEDPDDLDGDGISGRLNVVLEVETGSYVVGRFGWKSEQPSVRQQSAGAFNGDIGITSSVFPYEDCTPAEAECASAQTGGDPEASDTVLDAVAIYSRLLAPPARARYADQAVLEGKALFSELGCDSCHTPKHETGPSDLEELGGQTIWPYTDLLLHDMGEALSDERPSFDALGSEWRTPPLWGIGRIPEVNGHDRLMHDGRARGVAEAILHHGGEGASARDAFSALSSDQRAKVVEFVESL